MTKRSLALFRTLRGRLVLLVCFATAPAILFIFYAALTEREAAMKRLELEARHLGSLAARAHRQQLEGAKHLLRHLTGALTCGEERALACPEYLPALLSGAPEFANIGLLRPDGGLACSAVQTPVADLHDNSAFTRALGSGDVEVGAYAVSTIIPGRPVLHLATAIRARAKAPCAVAFVAVDLQWLDQLARQANLPPDYTMLITDREGNILAQSGSPAAAAMAREGPRIPGLVQAYQRESGVILQVGSPRVSRFFVATPMEGMDGVFVVAGLPVERVEAETNRAFYRTLVVLVLLTLFTVLSAIVVAEVSVLRVLRALSHTARVIGDGDLTARALLPRTEGELLQLAASFNTMAEALETRQREATVAQAQLRALSHRLQTARDVEGSRIARELHDELGQVLTSLKIDLARLRRASPELALGDLNERIDGAIDFVRRIASELRPTVLDRLGLAAALEWLVDGFETKTGLTVLSEVRDVEELIDPTVATALFRIVQEALTNVARHAGASEVKVELVGEPDALRLTVHDDGTGIAADATDKSLGILGMSERAHLLGGTFEIEGGPSGTTIRVVVPRKPAEIVEGAS